MDLAAPCTQKEFADLVGVGQPVVSELLTRGVLKPKDPARIWLLAYTSHLREQAAGRGGDGMLALNRAAESATRNELLQIKLKTARGEYAPVDALQQVLAYIGTRVASKLEPLPARIKMLCPQLTAEDMKGIEAAITDARNIAASASLELLDVDDTEVDDIVTAT
jgi:terminase small subunit / prophage DNA-packing protein